MSESSSLVAVGVLLSHSHKIPPLLLLDVPSMPSQQLRLIIMKPLFNIPQLKIFPHLIFSINGPRSIKLDLNYLQLRYF
jgi:hypothetical protein